MFCVVGLGNPGNAYDNTRHNIGFEAADKIVEKYCDSERKLKFRSEFFQGRAGDVKLFVLKPLTYMNRSGISAAELRSFYKIPIENFIVIHDELDLPTGSVRVKQGGGNAGHNGLKSLDTTLGQAYYRIRIGVDKPPFKGDGASWVLGKFSGAENKILEKPLALIAESLPVFIKEGAEAFKSRLTLGLK